MRVFVTGGAGYIGSVVVEELVSAGDEVIVFDNFSQGHRAAVHPAARLIEGDLGDRVAVDSALATTQPEAIMHFASRTLVGESMHHPFLYLGENVVNGINLLECAVNYGVRKIILSSTANLFDRPDRVPITEETPIRPGSPYGESKLMLERMLYWLEQTHGVHYAALRYFNAAGATAQRGEDHTPETHLIPLVLQVALGQRQQISIYGNDYPTPDGTCVRDYIHVIDLAQAHILALRSLDKGSRTYNLGTGHGYSVQEVVDCARAITGHPIPTQVGPRRAGDPAILVAGNERIRRELKWVPHYRDLETIMESAWRWHRAHPHGYEE